MSTVHAQGIVDVAIVGGGPGGLALAVGLLRANDQLKVKVFERASALRPVGSFVVIYPYGHRALEVVDPVASEWLSSKTPMPATGVLLDSEGKVVNTISLKPPSTDGGCRTAVGWYELQQELLKHLPEGIVHLGHEFERYEEDGDGVTVHFKNCKEPIRAKIMVGCDGFFSSVRMECLRDGRPTFGGSVLWRGRLPWREGMLREDASHQWSGNQRVGLLMPIQDGIMGWSAVAKIEELEACGVDYRVEGRTRASVSFSEEADESLKERCLRVFGNFAPAFVDVVKDTEDGAVLETGIFHRSAEEIPEDGWGRGHVTLLGDAAHPLRPTGEGLNMALEDAAVLAAEIKQKGVTVEALRTYEASRGPRLKAVAAYTAAYVMNSYKPGSVALPMTAEEFEEMKDSLVLQPL
eukprot:jgi/Botrbrau1/23075/Bobra.0243s0016.1